MIAGEAVQRKICVTGHEFHTKPFLQENRHTGAAVPLSLRVPRHIDHGGQGLRDL